MTRNAGETRFPQGTDLYLNFTIGRLRDEPTFSGLTADGWTFALTVRVNPDDVVAAIYSSTTPTIINEGGDGTDPKIQFFIPDSDTDSFSKTLVPATSDGLYPQRTHAFDLWRTNAGFETQLAYGTFRVDEAVRTIT